MNPLSPVQKEVINRRKRKTGCTQAQYRTLFLVQKGKCALCRRPPGKRALAADHDHKTKRLRGLLCTRCNLMLGMAKDDIALLERAISYLDY